MVALNLEEISFTNDERVLNLINSSNDWISYLENNNRLEDTSDIKKIKGNTFELLTILLLINDPVYSSKLKNVWHSSNLPLQILDLLGLQKPEVGVDIIAEDNEGKFWAIQCKFHQDTNLNITYEEVSQFFGVTERLSTYQKLSHRIISTSSIDLSPKIEKIHKDKLGYITYADFSNLDEDDFNNFRLLLKGGTSLIEERNPRGHQKEAISNSYEYFFGENNSRGKLIHPCGAGKSLTGFWIFKELQAKNALIAVPSLFLVKQTLKEWAKESTARNETFDWIVICSDEKSNDFSDEPSMRKIDLGIKVDTDKEKIAEFLNNQNSKNKIVITTYQSGQSLIDGIRLANNFSFDFGIFDEAHKTAGDKNKSFAKLLHDENVLVQKRLFMTATERVYKGDSDKIISMDDEEIYGKVIHQLSFKSALEQDPPVLSKYKIVTNRVNKKYIQDLINENKLVRANNKQWSYDADCSTFASLISLRQLVKQENLKHVVSFHSSIPRSKEFKLLNDQLNNFSSEFGTLHTSQISGKDSSGVRTKVLSEFKSFEPSLITNARCLTEGVDIPVIDAVLFADPKKSTVDIVQAAGRAMRRCEGKEYGYIIVPIIVDEDEEGSIHKDSFKQIINVISAMGMNDDRIIAEFQALVFKQTRETNICDFDFESVAESINLKDFYLNIQNKVWDRLSFAKSFIDESTFANWMRTATTLSEKSIKNYVGGVNTITNGLIKMRPEYKNIDDLIKSEDLSLLKKEWMSIEENLALDTRGNGMYSAGFNKLIEYANYKKMIKD